MLIRILGSKALTNESGCGSRRPKNIRILRIRMRIRIPNIGTMYTIWVQCSLGFMSDVTTYCTFRNTVVFRGANTEMGSQMSKSLTCNTGPGGLALFDHVLRHGEAARVLRIIFPDVRSSFSTEFFLQLGKTKN